MAGEKRSASYSLVHLTHIGCAPPEMIRVAARAGYDCVSLRTIPMRLPGEKPWDIARDRQLLLDTRSAARETGVYINDTENARILDGVDVADYEGDLAAAAELGIRHILSNIWTDDRAFYTEQFCKLCALASQYEQTVNVEFVTWASVKDLRTAAQLLWDSGCENVGIVVDALHFYRSRVQPEELEALPQEWFHFAHLCDAGAEIPTDTESLVHTGRAERLYPGEGAIDIAGILKRIPNAVRGVEVPHLQRLEELGYEEHACRALQGARRVMKQA